LSNVSKALINRSSLLILSNKSNEFELAEPGRNLKIDCDPAFADLSSGFGCEALLF
jgi:hypothetical protein